MTKRACRGMGKDYHRGCRLSKINLSPFFPMVSIYRRNVDFCQPKLKQLNNSFLLQATSLGRGNAFNAF